MSRGWRDRKQKQETRNLSSVMAVASGRLLFPDWGENDLSADHRRVSAFVWPLGGTIVSQWNRGGAREGGGRVPPQLCPEKSPKWYIPEKRKKKIPSRTLPRTLSLQREQIKSKAALFLGPVMLTGWQGCDATPRKLRLFGKHERARYVQIALAHIQTVLDARCVLWIHGM